MVFLCWPFHFPLFSPKFSLFQHEAGVLSISLQLTSIQSYGLQFKIIHIFNATNTKSLYARFPHKASQYGDYSQLSLLKQNMSLHLHYWNGPVSRKRKNARNAVYVRDVTVGVHPASPLCTETYGGFAHCMLKSRKGLGRPCYRISI